MTRPRVRRVAHVWRIRDVCISVPWLYFIYPSARHRFTYSSAASSSARHDSFVITYDDDFTDMVNKPWCTMVWHSHGVPWFIRMNPSACHNSFIISDDSSSFVMLKPWLIHHMCAMQRTCERVMSHIQISHVTHMNESCHTCEGVILHDRMSPVAHVRMSHVTHRNESRHTYE